MLWHPTLLLWVAVQLCWSIHVEVTSYVETWISSLTQKTHKRRTTNWQPLHCTPTLAKIKCYVPWELSNEQEVPSWEWKNGRGGAVYKKRAARSHSLTKLCVNSCDRKTGRSRNSKVPGLLMYIGVWAPSSLKLAFGSETQAHFHISTSKRLHIAISTIRGLHIDR